MGLNESRKIEELKTVTFPGRVKEIEEICGKAIPYDVDWQSLADDGPGLNFLDNLSCHRLNMALRVICCDEMGKEAVRKGLKQVKLKNVKGGRGEEDVVRRRRAGDALRLRPGDRRHARRQRDPGAAGGQALTPSYGTPGRGAR